MGIETMGNMYDIVIESNSTIPTKKPKRIQLPQIINQVWRYTFCREKDQWQGTIEAWVDLSLMEFHLHREAYRKLK